MARAVFPLATIQGHEGRGDGGSGEGAIALHLPNGIIVAPLDQLNSKYTSYAIVAGEMKAQKNPSHKKRSRIVLRAG